MDKKFLYFIFLRKRFSRMVRLYLWLRWFDQLGDVGRPTIVIALFFISLSIQISTIATFTIKNIITKIVSFIQETYFKAF